MGTRGWLVIGIVLVALIALSYIGFLWWESNAVFAPCADPC
jgi:hypothetical protein